eukprot:scaffold22436_cov44-Cylindrotheca_fusiformis.AAC.2
MSYSRRSIPSLKCFVLVELTEGLLVIAPVKNESLRDYLSQFRKARDVVLYVFGPVVYSRTFEE